MGLLLGIAALLLGFAAPLTALPSPVQNALGIALFALLFWTTEPIPIALSSVGVLALIPAVGLLSFEQSLAPFASKTVWLVLAGMALSLGVAKTGLGDALASWLQSRLSQRPFLLLCQLHLIGLVTAFLIPSGVIRVLFLMPIGIALVERLHIRPSPHLKAAVLLSLLCSTYFRWLWAFDRLCAQLGLGWAIRKNPRRTHILGHLAVLDVSGHRLFANAGIARRDLDAFRPPSR